MGPGCCRSSEGDSIRAKGYANELEGHASGEPERTDGTRCPRFAEGGRVNRWVGRDGQGYSPAPVGATPGLLVPDVEAIRLKGESHPLGNREGAAHAGIQVLIAWVPQAVRCGSSNIADQVLMVLAWDR